MIDKLIAVICILNKDPVRGRVDNRLQQLILLFFGRDVPLTAEEVGNLAPFVFNGGDRELIDKEGAVFPVVAQLDLASFAIFERFAQRI